MGTPLEVLGLSTEYFRIYFAGSLGFIMYNIFVGILQAAGDSRHPLIYLVISSLINIVLDLIFVAGLHLGGDRQPSQRLYRSWSALHSVGDGC